MKMRSFSNGTKCFILLLSTTLLHQIQHSHSNPYQITPPRHHKISSSTISLHGGLPSLLREKWCAASDLAQLEQTVEDYNSEIVATALHPVAALMRRRLIVLPLDERFDPPTGVFSHGHVQTGDKMSLPRVFWDAIVKGQAEVPWLFEVSRVEGVTTPITTTIPASSPLPFDAPPLPLQRTVGGALDFRSPPNYIFLPRWMLLSLRLKPLDVVDVRLITDVPAGSAVRLRPHSSDFVAIGNHRAVLETELKHYSALTKGATIPFDYNGKRYFFDVVDLRSAPRGEKADMVKVQDCDIAAEFVRAKDVLMANKKKKEKERKEKEMQQL